MWREVEGFTNTFVKCAILLFVDLCSFCYLVLFLSYIMNNRHVRNFAEFKVEQGKKSDTEKFNDGNNSGRVLM